MLHRPQVLNTSFQFRQFGERYAGEPTKRSARLLPTMDSLYQSQRTVDHACSLNGARRVPPRGESVRFLCGSTVS